MNATILIAQNKLASPEAMRERVHIFQVMTVYMYSIIVFVAVIHITQCVCVEVWCDWAVRQAINGSNTILFLRRSHCTAEYNKWWYKLCFVKVLLCDETPWLKATNGFTAGACVRPQSHCLHVCIISFDGFMYFAVRILLLGFEIASMLWPSFFLIFLLLSHKCVNFHNYIKG